jgi:peptidyl-prolyl cis-trans isomerase C
MNRALFLAAMAGAVVSGPSETRAAGAPSASAATSAVASAGPTADDTARRALPVAEIGPRSITVGELEDRIAALPPFQRATFGADADSVRRKFLLEVLVPEGLFALGAADQKLDQKLPTAFDVERALQNGTLRAVRRALGPETAIPMSDVQAYYDANRDKYDTPERYEIWRILCKTREEAASVIDALHPALTPQKFGELARQHSLDKASSMRAGNLGFVTAEGTSNEPGLRVEPALVQAVRGVRDGQLVPAPVQEKDGFSVAWRKGTIAANKRTVDDVAAQIRDIVWKARVKDRSDFLIAHLRADRLKDLNEGALSDLPVTTAETPARPPRAGGGG